jgi:hypothetical protein
MKDVAKVEFQNSTENAVELLCGNA